MLPGKRQAVRSGLLHGQRAALKGPACVAHAHKTQLVTNDGTLQPRRNVPPGQVGAVDLLVPGLAATGHGLPVVSASKQVQIPNLRLARHKQLQSARQEHLAVVLAQSAVIGGVHLVIQVLLAVQALDQPSAGYHQVNQRLDALHRQQPLEIQKRDAVVAAQHVYRADALVPFFLGPPGQIFAGMVFDGINDQPRQEEVIGHVALPGQGAVCAFGIAGVDFRQEGQPQRLSHAVNLLQQVPGFRLVHEVAPSRLLGSVGEGIQPDDGRTIASQLFQCFTIILPHQGRFQVEIHLPQVTAAGFYRLHRSLAAAFKTGEVGPGRPFARLYRRIDSSGQPVCLCILQAAGRHQILRVKHRIAHLLIEGVPVRPLAAIGHANHQDGQARLAEEHVLNQCRVWLDVSLRRHLALSRPEAVPVDKEVTVGRFIAPRQQILKLRAEHGKVIEHKVQLQIQPKLAHTLKTALIGQQAVEIVTGHGKAAVQIAVEQAGQDVKRPKCPPAFGTGQKVRLRRQVAAQAIRISIEHHALIHRGSSSRLRHQAGILLIGHDLAGLGKNQFGLVSLRLEHLLFQLQHHGGKGAVRAAIAVARLAVSQGFRGCAVEQYGNIDALIPVGIAVRPLDHQHAFAGHIHCVIPQLGGRAAHSLEVQRGRALFEIAHDMADLVKVDFLLCTQISAQGVSARLLVDSQPGIMAYVRERGVAVLGPELPERLRLFRAVHPIGNQPFQPAVMKHTATLGVILFRVAAGVVVPRQGIRPYSLGV